MASIGQKYCPSCGSESCGEGYKPGEIYSCLYSLAPETPTTFNSVVDSGSRQSFTTGSVRDTQEGKGRFDLLSPEVLIRDAKHMENGAKKYGDRNWEKGQPVSRYFDSAFRHMVKALRGDTDEDHLAAARWNLAGVIFTEAQVKAGKLDKTLLDMPYHVTAVTA